MHAIKNCGSSCGVRCTRGNYKKNPWSHYRPIFKRTPLVPSPPPPPLRRNAAAWRGAKNALREKQNKKNHRRMLGENCVLAIARSNKFLPKGALLFVAPTRNYVLRVRRGCVAKNEKGKKVSARDGGGDGGREYKSAGKFSRFAR